MVIYIYIYIYIYIHIHIYIYNLCAVRYVCIYVHTHIHTHARTHTLLHNIEKLVGQNKKKKIETAVNAACHFWHVCHSLVSPSPDRYLGLFS